MGSKVERILFGMSIGFLLTLLLLSLIGKNTRFYKNGYYSGYKQGQIDAFRLNIHWRIARNEDGKYVWTYFEEPKDSFTEDLFKISNNK